MPDFLYKAKDGPDKVIEGSLEAANEAAAIERINQLGFVPISVHRSEDVESDKRSQRFFWRAASRRRLILFSRYLASFIRSGVPLLRGLEIQIQQEEHAGFRQILEKISGDVRHGQTLSHAIEKFPRIFSPMYVSVVRAGETSGSLPEALTKMAEYLKKQEAVYSKVRQAFTYPAVLCLAGLGTIYYILTFVVPRLSAVFISTGQALPLPTRIVIATGQFMNHYALGILLFAAMVLFAVRQFFSREYGKQFVDHAKLNLPALGSFVFKILFARFARALQMGIVNGLPFLEALRLAIPTLNNEVLSQSMDGCYKRVQKGDSFGTGLKSIPYIPTYVANLVMVGEEAGRVEESLSEIAETYEHETDEALHVFTTLLEPLMIFVVGSIVGFIVIALLLPVFEMNTIIQ